MTYKPPLIFRNGHVNTVYTSLFRKQETPPYQRRRISTVDHDFLDIDLLEAGHKKLAILCHGLEGSSSSQYIVGTGRILHKEGWNIAAYNYRYCSGDINKQVRMYHSGATDDLDTVIKALADGYSEVVLIGFSLGGNLVLKYCGERGSSIDSKLSHVVAVSVPVDLGAGSININQRSNHFYQQNFLKSLTLKLKAKHEQHPHTIDLSLLSKVKTLYDFDDYYTGPIHGFKNAQDYYTQCSAKQFIHNLTIPTLIINALDDPFLPKECYPYKESADNKHVELVTPKYGGHVGFIMPKSDHCWEELRIAEYLRKDNY